MKKYAQLQYQGLNLLDEVGTVQITIDYEASIIHIYDTQQIVAPEYDFIVKNYTLTSSFYQMAAAIRQKNFLQIDEHLSLEQWVDNSTWYFYGITHFVKRYANGTMATEQISTSEWYHQLYSKYYDETM